MVSKNATLGSRVSLLPRPISKIPTLSNSLRSIAATTSAVPSRQSLSTRHLALVKKPSSKPLASVPLPAHAKLSMFTIDEDGATFKRASTFARKPLDKPRTGPPPGVGYLPRKATSFKPARRTSAVRLTRDEQQSFCKRMSSMLPSAPGAAATAKRSSIAIRRNTAAPTTAVAGRMIPMAAGAARVRIIDYAGVADLASQRTTGGTPAEDFTACTASMAQIFQQPDVELFERNDANVLNTLNAIQKDSHTFKMPTSFVNRPPMNVKRGKGTMSLSTSSSISSTPSTASVKRNSIFFRDDPRHGLLTQSLADARVSLLASMNAPKSTEHEFAVPKPQQGSIFKKVVFDNSADISNVISTPRGCTPQRINNSVTTTIKSCIRSTSKTTKAELSKKKLTFLTPNSDAETPSSSNRGKKKLLDITNSGESMINKFAERKFSPQDVENIIPRRLSFTAGEDDFEDVCDGFQSIKLLPQNTDDDSDDDEAYLIIDNEKKKALERIKKIDEEKKDLLKHIENLNKEIANRKHLSYMKWAAVVKPDAAECPKALSKTNENCTKVIKTKADIKKKLKQSWKNCRVIPKLVAYSPNRSSMESLSSPVKRLSESPVSLK